MSSSWWPIVSVIVLDPGRLACRTIGSRIAGGDLDPGGSLYRPAVMAV